MNTSIRYYVAKLDLTTGALVAVRNSVTGEICWFEDTERKERTDPTNAYNRATSWINDVLPEGVYQIQQVTVKSFPA